MTDTQLQQVKEALTIASKYCRDPDETYLSVSGPQSMTLGYTLPPTREQVLLQKIEDLKRHKADAKFIRDTLTSL